MNLCLKIIILFSILGWIEVIMIFYTFKTNEIVLLYRMKGFEEQLGGDYLTQLFVSKYKQSIFNLWSPFNKFANYMNIINDRLNYMDLAIVRSVDLGFQQVVVVGSGYSTFPYRFNMYHDVQFYELDYPSVLEEKKRTLMNNNVMIPQNVHFVGVDFSVHCDLMELLTKNDSNMIDVKKPTLFILEGIIMYLSVETNYCLFKSIANWGARTISVGDAILAVDNSTSNYLAQFIKFYLDFIREPMKFNMPNQEKDAELWLKNISQKFIIEDFRKMAMFVFYTFVKT